MEAQGLRAVLSTTPGGVAVRVKVVPGSSRTRVVGILGDRLKLTVAVPPSGGRANEAVCRVLSELFAVSQRQVQIVAGHGQPQKIVEITGIALCRAVELLAKALAEPKG